MICSTTRLDGVVIIEPEVFTDSRGFFMECYVRETFRKFGIDTDFVQDNYSLSVVSGTIRGMHFQIHPWAQSKLIKVVRGEIFNVVVDIRQGSPTFRQWLGVRLSAENKKQLFVPKGFANGYCTLTDNTEIWYKVDQYYASEFDRTFRWNDPRVAIEWPVSQPVLSRRDQEAPGLSEIDNNFFFEGG
jgi:dTDP-4-dehydrorhamnose 3,5-epimerase